MGAVDGGAVHSPWPGLRVVAASVWGVGSWASGERSRGTGSHRSTGLFLRRSSAWSRRWIRAVPAEMETGCGEGVSSSITTGSVARVGVVAMGIHRPAVAQ